MFDFPPPQSQQTPLPHRSWIGRHTMVFSLISLTLFLFLVATNTQSGWIFVMVACLSATLLLCGILPHLMLRGLRITRRFPQAARAGEELSITVVLSNESSYPKFGISVVECFPNTIPDITPERRFYVDYLPAHSTSSFIYKLKCNMRGRHRFREIAMESSFPLSMFFARKKIKNDEDLIVAPQIYRLSDESIGDISGAQLQHSLRNRGQSDDFYGLREYVYGDNLRQVHWAASAHSGELMVREYQETSAQRHLLIAIDPTRYLPLLTPEQEDLESALTLAATWADWAKGAAIPVDIATVRNGQLRLCPEGSESEFFAAIQIELDEKGPTVLQKWLEETRSQYASCQTLIFTVPGREQQRDFSPNFGADHTLRIVCAPSDSIPSLCLSFSGEGQEQQRHYLSIKDKRIPKDIRQQAQNWAPFLTANSYSTQRAYVCGDQDLSDVLHWIAERR